MALSSDGNSPIGKVHLPHGRLLRVWDVRTCSPGFVTRLRCQFYSIHQLTTGYIGHCGPFQGVTCSAAGPQKPLRLSETSVVVGPAALPRSPSTFRSCFLLQERSPNSFQIPTSMACLSWSLLPLKLSGTFPITLYLC